KLLSADVTGVFWSLHLFIIRGEKQIVNRLLEKLRDKITECKPIPAERLSQGSSEFRKNSVQLLKTGVMNDDITSTFFPLFDYNIGAQPCRYIFLQA
ncbi:hypothetical protein SAMN05216379_1361, partial [Nitrosomonas eutropha]